MMNQAEAIQQGRRLDAVESQVKQARAIEVAGGTGQFVLVVTDRWGRHTVVLEPSDMDFLLQHLQSVRGREVPAEAIEIPRRDS